MNRIKLIVCDMAGTTINEGGIVYRTLINTIKDQGIKIKENEIHKWHGANKKEVINHFVHREYGVDEKIENLLLNNFEENLKKQYINNPNITLIDSDLPKLFADIRGLGMKIVLNTGYSKDIQENVLSLLDMKQHIDGYISSEEVKHGRPEPYMIHKLMERFNITDSKEVVKIGDTRNDIFEGLNANCYRTIGVATGADSREKLFDAGAHYVYNSIMDFKIAEPLKKKK